eukprot:269245-Amphidinium_carterae.1
MSGRQPIEEDEIGGSSGAQGQRDATMRDIKFCRCQRDPGILAHLSMHSLAAHALSDCALWGAS